MRSFIITFLMLLTIHEISFSNKIESEKYISFINDKNHCNSTFIINKIIKRYPKNNSKSIPFNFSFFNKFYLYKIFQEQKPNNINFSNRQSLELGDYFSIKGHPKAKGVNMKLRVPVGWEVKEGERPSIVCKFVRKGHSYMVLVQENDTFFSRNETWEGINDENFVYEHIKSYSNGNYQNFELLDHSTTRVDTYPTLIYKFKFTRNISGRNMTIIMKSWMIFVEDKIVFLQSSYINFSKIKYYNALYDLITLSVVFPDQYRD